MSIDLRLADDADKDYFLALRNTPDAVKFSGTKRIVSPEEHAAWWKTTEDVRFVAEGLTGPVGVVRFTRLAGSRGRVHVAVAPQHQGMGYGSGILLEATVEGRRLGYTRLVADVDARNTASLRAFLRAGYEVRSDGLLELGRDL